jgi:hypothetical protein
MAGCCVCVRDDYQVWSCALLGLWPGVRRAARPSTQSPPLAPGLRTRAAGPLLIQIRLNSATLALARLTSVGRCATVVR